MLGETRPHPVITWGGMLLGPVLGIALFFLLPAAQTDEAGKVIAGLSHEARIVAGIAALMAIWWVTEAIPIEATSLLPLVLLPIFGVVTMKQAAAPYGSEQVFFFMGGFMLGKAMERWGLHTRIALHILRAIGTSPSRLVLGLMTATACISLFVNNTATTIVMLPIGLSLANALAARAGPDSRLTRNFAKSAVLGIAYAASLGGMGTLIGTAPNIQLAAFFSNTVKSDLSFANWLIIGLPIVAILTPLTWLMMTKLLFPLRDEAHTKDQSVSASQDDPAMATDTIRGQLRSLGPMSCGELVTLIVFIVAAAAWVLREWLCAQLGLVREEKGQTVALVPDAWIGMAASLALFLIPINRKERQFALDWKAASGLPWGILLLFGGGLSLADAMTTTGVDRYIGTQLGGLGVLPIWAMTILVALTIAAASELASNTALTAAMLPIMFGLEKELQLPPGTLLIPTTLAASCGFMFPVATPPNAIAFATGHIPLRSMLYAGFLLDVLGVLVISGIFLALGHYVMPAHSP